MLTQQHSERSIDFEMGRKPYCGPGRLGCWGLGDRPGPGAAIRGAPMLQTNNRAAGSKVREVRQPRLASCSGGHGYGVSGASITPRWRARSPSFCGGRMLQATNCVPAHAAPAGEKARPASVRAGLAIILASSRFQQSPTKCVEQHWRRNELPATCAFLTG
jgi:hypothetical protein